MATNEILPFATDDTGTNLLTQSEYSADAQREIGHQPGIARSKLTNKTMRQTSLLAAGLAEFIADYQANNVTDGLTPQQIADYLLAAITANIPVIPDASNTTKGIIETATAGEAQTFASALLAITPSTLNQSLKGSNQNLATNGYQRLPGGLIFQWGLVSGGANPRAVTFPIAFPNAVFSISGAVIAESSEAFAQSVASVSKTGFTSYSSFSQGFLLESAFFFAIGH